jgi:hypothetical protein
MAVEEIAANDVVTLDDIKELAGASGPCITMVTRIPTPFELAARMKNAVRSLENRLAERETASAAIDSLMQPVRDLSQAAENAGTWSNALIVFRSPAVFRYFLLSRPVPEMESIEERFQVRPLLGALAREQRFHLLCLSRRHIRLLDATEHRMEEQSTRGIVPQDMDVWLNERQPDHMLDNRSAAGPSVGSMKGVMFGTSRDPDRDDEYLAHFYKEVDKGVNKLLHNDPAKLLLAGVETEVAAYRTVSAYPRLFERAVVGSCESLVNRELHERAMDVVTESRSGLLEEALAEFERRRDSRRVSTDARQAVKAALEGRVADLFLSEDAALRGVWNPETFEIETGDPREDLLNAAALETVRHGGRAFLLERTDMPMPADVVAVLRF